jgi:hypothetical protein
MPLRRGASTRKLNSSLSRALRAPQYITWWTYSFLRTNPPIWNILNQAGKALHEEQAPNLDELQQAVVNTLVQDGIAFVHLDELFPDKQVTSELIEHMELRKGEAMVGETKPFLQYFSGELGTSEVAIIELDSPFIRFSLDRRILDVVNSYIGICSKLVHFELGMTNLMSPGAAPARSQRWHRDPGMKKLIKMFIYLTDVDEEAGPFSYVVKSHAGGRWGSLFPQKQFGRRGMYPPEGAVDEAVSKSDIRVCTGRAGTVIFCDTTGLHKGGYSISKPRIMSTSVYVAEGDVIKRRFRYPTDFEERISTLGAISRFALK